jgi:CheY-like chemotaxis protein
MHRSSTSSPRVLLVDAHCDTAELYATALRARGWQVSVAHDGEQAWARASSLHPDVLVTELALPIVSGVELTRRLRDDEPAVAIVALTAQPVSAGGDACIPGCDSVLLKPCSPARLMSAIEDALEARRAAEIQARTRIRAEYLEMPGMRLSAAQVQRLCGLERPTCLAVLHGLVGERFLVLNTDGTYARATDDSAVYAPAANVSRVAPHVR